MVSVVLLLGKEIIALVNPSKISNSTLGHKENLVKEGEYL